MPSEPPKVFVIHGHNELARLQLCEMLSKEFQLEPVLLNQQPGLGQTIIERLEQTARQCVLAVGLLTSDDLSLAGQSPTTRATQNVIFELGYFCAFLGRERVCLVRQDGVELPSDLDGVLYYRFKTNATEVHPSLKRHLQHLGLTGSPLASTSTVLVVDDDLTINSPLVRHLQSALAPNAHVEVIRDSEEAIRTLRSGRRFLGCITDIVFRNAVLGGVRISETAIGNNIKLLVMSGHKKQDLGLALTELSRLGLSEDSLLTKPVTLGQYRSFLRRVKDWLA